MVLWDWIGKAQVMKILPWGIRTMLIKGFCYMIMVQKGFEVTGRNQEKKKVGRKMLYMTR